ncbi:MAG: N-acetyltransferase family protein [Bacillota bacterium]
MNTGYPESPVFAEVEPGDLREKEELAALDGTIFGAGSASIWIMAPLIRCGKVYSLRLRQQLIGVAEFFRSWLRKDCGFLLSFGIHPDFRGKGYGRWFLGKCLESLEKDGIRGVELTVAPDNRCALRLYEDMGFHKIKELPDEYGRGEYRWLMRLGFPGA